MDTSSKVAIIKDEKGIAIIYLAVAIVVLVAFLGMAVDLGHMQAVRGELQNDADAAALAGAKSLYVSSPGTLPVLNWGQGQTDATAFVKQNKSDGSALQTGTIVYGYWNVSQHSWASGSPVSAGTPPPPPTLPGVPAVGATVSRSAASNGGGVPTFLMMVLGIDQAPVSSRQAVATSGFPGAVSPGKLFPLAISSCMTNSIFSQPPSTWPSTVVLNSPYGAGGANCYSGQWTSFKLDANDVPTIRGLITNGNPTALQTGDSIWIEPGAKATLYNPNSWTPSMPAGGEDVLLAIVDTRSSDLSTKGTYTITGFAEFHIDGGNQGSMQIIGHFLAYYPQFPPGIAPGGSVSNVVTPPVMAQ